MDNSKSDNHIELMSRRHSSRDAVSTQATADRENKRLSLAAVGSDVTDRADSIPYAEVHSMPMISTISGKRPSTTSTSGDATSTRSNSSKRRINRNALTTSFLRRKRVEYAGMELSRNFVLWIWIGAASSIFQWFLWDFSLTVAMLLTILCGTAQIINGIGRVSCLKIESRTYLSINFLMHISNTFQSNAAATKQKTNRIPNSDSIYFVLFRCQFNQFFGERITNLSVELIDCAITCTNPHIYTVWTSSVVGCQYFELQWIRSANEFILKMIERNENQIGIVRLQFGRGEKCLCRHCFTFCCYRTRVFSMCV